MTGPALVPCLVQLRTEFNRIAPARRKDSDGWIGDSAHRDRVSDHNPDETGRVPITDSDRVDEVHAVDVDVDLRESDLTMHTIVAFLVGRARAGIERRLRYIIFNRTIWHVNNLWRPEDYTGTNPHTGHAHFSASYDAFHEANKASWHLEDIPVSLTPADRTWIEGLVREELDEHLNAIGPMVWNHTEPNPEDLDDNDLPRPGRMGGWARMANKRDNDRLNVVLAEIVATREKLEALIAEITPPAAAAPKPGPAKKSTTPTPIDQGA